MATTARYAAPYARTGTHVRPSPRVDTSIVRLALLCMIGAAIIALAQLYLTGEASDTIKQMDALEKQNTVLQGEIDDLLAQVEQLRSPRRIEADATRLGLKPFASVEYLR